MHTNDFETFAHDAYEWHLYEKFRTEYPNETPVQTAMRVIGALELGEGK